MFFTGVLPKVGVSYERGKGPFSVLYTGEKGQLLSTWIGFWKYSHLIMKKPFFRFWSKCEKYFLTFTPTGESCSFLCHCPTPTSPPQFTMLPVFRLCEHSRIKGKNRKCITGRLRSSESSRHAHLG